MSDAGNDDVLVGYKRPPRQHQFQPGKSGNPRGRPKGARGFKTEVREALNARISVTEGGRKKTISTVAAALRRLIQKAVANGNIRALERVLVLAQQHDVEPAQVSTDLSAEDQLILADFQRRTAEEDGHE